jgi:hypothetical protein
MPRSKGAANFAGYEETTGHAPSPEAAGYMFGGGRSFAPSFGATTVGGEDGGPPQVAVINRRTGTVTPTGQTAARPAPAAGAPQNQKDWTNAISTAKGEKDLMGNPLNKTEEQITARAQTIYDATQHGRQRIAPAPRVDKGPATSTTQHAGTEQDPHTPQSDADFASLPQGAIYRDPGDNQLYRKP